MCFISNAGEEKSLLKPLEEDKISMNVNLSHRCKCQVLYRLKKQKKNSRSYMYIYIYVYIPARSKQIFLSLCKGLMEKPNGKYCRNI